ncbi:hypothetical protein ZWY2020_057725 [Hordeum vulgare]|nr:hypothetical protein ZWY2020_057725 [Hordeum vulgare]
MSLRRPVPLGATARAAWSSPPLYAVGESHGGVGGGQHLVRVTMPSHKPSPHKPRPLPRLRLVSIVISTLVHLLSAPPQPAPSPLLHHHKPGDTSAGPRILLGARWRPDLALRRDRVSRLSSFADTALWSLLTSMEFAKEKVLMKASMLGLRQTMLWAHLECRSSSLMMMQEGKEKCEHQQCHLGSNFVPELLGHFLATENFYFMSKTGLHQLYLILWFFGEQLCNKDLSTLKQKYLNHSDEDFSRYCFSSAYMVALLHDSLGVPLDDKRQAYHTRTPSFFLS